MNNVFSLYESIKNVITESNFKIGDSVITNFNDVNKGGKYDNRKAKITSIKKDRGQTVYKITFDDNDAGFEVYGNQIKKTK